MSGWEELRRAGRHFGGGGCASSSSASRSNLDKIRRVRWTPRTVSGGADRPDPGADYVLTHVGPRSIDTLIGLVAHVGLLALDLGGGAGCADLRSSTSLPERMGYSGRAIPQVALPIIIAGARYTGPGNSEASTGSFPAALLLHRRLFRAPGCCSSRSPADE